MTRAPTMPRKSRDPETGMITRMEELAMNAWPALQTHLFDGWILRFAGGVTKRSNSVNPIYDSHLPTEGKISYCESLFLARNLAVVFKLTKKVFPPDLESALEARGYRFASPTSVQILDIKNARYNAVGAYHVAEEVDTDWLDHFIHLSGADGANRLTYLRTLEQITNRKCLLTYYLEQQPVACGLGVVESGFLGLFDIVVAPAYRQAGFGRLVMENILHWGIKAGAEKAYLQVKKDNTPALRLYQKMGFLEIYQYWYRIKGKAGGKE